MTSRSESACDGAQTMLLPVLSKRLKLDARMHMESGMS